MKLLIILILKKGFVENSTQLINSQIKLLENLPEQGMGYQIVDIEMNNGTV